MKSIQMDRVQLLRRWHSSPELQSLISALEAGDNYVLNSLNKEFKYLLHCIASVYNIPSMSYLNTKDAVTRQKTRPALDLCKWCRKDGIEMGTCHSCKSKCYNENNFIVITVDQKNMDNFIDQLKSQFGSSPNVYKGLRNGRKFICNEQFKTLVKQLVPITIAQPKDNPIGPFKSEAKILEEKKQICDQVLVKLEYLKKCYLDKINSKDILSAKELLKSLDRMCDQVNYY